MHNLDPLIWFFEYWYVIPATLLAVVGLWVAYKRGKK